MNIKSFFILLTDWIIFDIILISKTKGKPTAIIANTIKGKGVSFMENNAGWHGKAPNDEELEKALAELA